MKTALRFVFISLVLGLMVVVCGCAPVLIGGGAAGGYKVGTDERSVDRMFDDVGISTAVKAELARDSVMAAYEIDVDVVEGYVTLTGVVKTRTMADRAVKIAQSVNGVKGVRDNLQIGEETIAGSVNDAWISSKIKSKLIAEPGIRSLNIDVDVHRGVVTLTGLLSDNAQKRRAIAVAQGTEGVVEVVDNLTVKYP